VAAAVRPPLGPRVRQLCQPLNGNLLVRPFGGGGGHVFRIEMSNPLAPHSDERPRCQLIHRFPRVFDGRKGIPPDRAFAPFFAFLHAFAGGTHGFPSDAIRLGDVLGGAFPALLMDQVKIAQGRLLVRHPPAHSAHSMASEFFTNDRDQVRECRVAVNAARAGSGLLTFAHLLHFDQQVRWTAQDRTRTIGRRVYDKTRLL